MLKDDFLQQNGISEYDRFCPFYKTTGMLRNFVTFHEEAVKAVSQGDLTFAKIKDSAADVMFKLSQMKFEVCIVVSWCRCAYLSHSPTQGKDAIKKKLDALYHEIQDKFRQLVE